MTVQRQIDTIRRCRVNPKRVFLEEQAADLEIVAGQGLCYVVDYTSDEDGMAAEDAFPGRNAIVTIPDADHNRNFAGVAAHDYSVAADTGRTPIEIYEPGSEVPVLLACDVTKGDFVTCSAGEADGGYWHPGAFPGRGTALILQTNADGVIGELKNGSASVSGTTVTATGQFADAEAGDIVVILGGEDGVNTPGKYTIDSVTDDDEVEVTEAPGDGNVCLYVLDGDTHQKALALLLDGRESGLVEWIGVTDDGAAAAMDAGETHICGGITIGDGDSTDTLADGDLIGLEKRFVLHGDLTTNDHVITLATRGEQLDGTTNLDTITMDANGDETLLEWMGSYWQAIANQGSALG